MAIRKLSELIKESTIYGPGGTGSANESFKNHVTGASGGGVSMTQYNINSIGWFDNGTPGQPSGYPVTVYNADTTFNMQMTVNRNSQAYNVQRVNNGNPPWTTLNVTAYDGFSSISGSSVSFNTYSTPGSPAGAQFNVGVRVLARNAPNGSVQGTILYDGGQTTVPASGVMWSGTFSAIAQYSGGLGTMDYYLNIAYDPGPAQYNDGWSQSWPFRMTDRAIDLGTYGFRWWTSWTEANNNNAGTAYSTSSNGGTWWSYKTTDHSTYLDNGEPGPTVYMRYLPPGGAWSAITTLQVAEDRLL